MSFGGPAPVVAWYPSESQRDEPVWVSATGRGEITPGAEAGPCRFLAPDEAKALYRNIGVTCTLTRHRVFLTAVLRPTAGHAGAELPRPGSRTMEVEVPSAEVVGVRYIIACALPQAYRSSERCRQA